MSCVIVTGASRGIGREVALWLAKTGANVLATARTHDKLVALQSEAKLEGMKGDIAIISGDICDEDFCQKVVNKAIEKFGSLMAVVNNAGVLGVVEPVADMSRSNLMDTLIPNLAAPLSLSQAAIPYLKKTNGRLIHVSSGASGSAIQGWSAYCMSKGWGESTARVAVRPGVVDTAMQGVIREDGDKGMDASVHDHFKNLKKQGQLLAPSDPAKSIAKLALHASETFSGKFVSWNDAEVMDLPLKL